MPLIITVEYLSNPGKSASFGDVRSIIKRQMYGRAGLELLTKRFILTL
ncbi:hypothetical protein [Chamaesiphon sp.]